MHESKNPHAVALGRIGGKVKSEAKKQSSRENGKKGGRPKNRIDWPSLLGGRFGGLTLTKLEPGCMATCLCICGKTHYLLRDSLIRGHTKSCGCLTQAYRKEASVRKGPSASSKPEYAVWAQMKQRCQNPNCPMFYLYGARGIGVCPEWQNSFQQFLFDLGPRPSSRHSLDRVDNCSGYSPSNCRWATAKQQSRNTRRTLFLTLSGVTKSMSDWAETLHVELGLTIVTIRQRKKRGWTDTRTLTTPHNNLLKNREPIP